MTSKAQLRNQFLYPTVSREDSTKTEKQARQRQSTVYDAVAGRISSTGFIPNHVAIASTRDTTSTSTTAVAPETVLFRRRNAPTRYAESDIYFANERTSPRDLPSSDLLKAIHSYASDFYSRATPDAGAGDWRSLDETALIALAVLMEEASRETLGETGDLVFVEGEDITPDATDPTTMNIDYHPQSDAVEIENRHREANPAKRRRVVEMSDD